MKDAQAKWIFCGLLFLAATLNYLDRQTMAVLGTEVIKDLGLNNESPGWLFAIFLLLVYLRAVRRRRASRSLESPMGLWRRRDCLVAGRRRQWSGRLS